MNDCPMSSKLTALREGWLEPEEAEDLRRHTAACARCRETAKRLEEAVRLLRHDADPVAPPRKGWEALSPSPSRHAGCAPGGSGPPAWRPS
jgi:anti-sigma factor ChrR (cupin superfamily)